MNSFEKKGLAILLLVLVMAPDAKTPLAFIVLRAVYGLFGAALLYFGEGLAKWLGESSKAQSEGK